MKIEILDHNVDFNPSPHYWQRGQISRASMDRNVILNFLRESCIDTKMSLVGDKKKFVHASQSA